MAVVFELSAQGCALVMCAQAPIEELRPVGPASGTTSPAFRSTDAFLMRPSGRGAIMRR